MYLRLPGARPIFQGDVFRDVPFAKVGQGNSPDTDPAFSSKRRHVATILYPCDMVTGDNVTLVRAQPIVRVYDAAAAGLAVSEFLDDVPVAVCPLPDLEGDGKMWVADFRTITVVDRSFLTTNRRVRCLSEYGWAVFRQRLGASTSRAQVDIKRLLDLPAAATWSESQMEARWVEHDGDRGEFHEWLDEQRDDLGHHATLRDALQDGDLELVLGALETELGD